MKAETVYTVFVIPQDWLSAGEWEDLRAGDNIDGAKAKAIERATLSLNRLDVFEKKGAVRFDVSIFPEYMKS